MNCSSRKYTIINKILVAYFTKGGATEEYATVIDKTLMVNGCKVEICNLAQDIPNVATFDIVVVGTGMRMFRVYGRWKKILKQKAFNSKHLFIYLSSRTEIKDPEKAVKKFLRPLIEKYGLKPESLISFPGKIPEK